MNEKWKEAETIQLKMAKRILRCARSTCNEVVLNELGLFGLRERRMVKQLKIWEKILSLKKHGITRKIYDLCVAKNVGWGKEIRKVCYRIWSD